MRAYVGVCVPLWHFAHVGVYCGLTILDWEGMDGCKKNVCIDLMDASSAWMDANSALMIARTQDLLAPACCVARLHQRTRPATAALDLQRPHQRTCTYLPGSRLARCALTCTNSPTNALGRIAAVALCSWYKMVHQRGIVTLVGGPAPAVARPVNF